MMGACNGIEPRCPVSQSVVQARLEVAVMIAEIALRREDLGELCGRFHVRRLDVFGSAAHGDFDPARSDLDFLVEFKPVASGAYADAFFGFKEALEELFGR